MKTTYLITYFCTYLLLPLTTLSMELVKKNTQPPGVFALLPQEVIKDKILNKHLYANFLNKYYSTKGSYKNDEEVDAAINLALTCKYFFKQFKPHAHKIIKSFFGRKFKLTEIDLLPSYIPNAARCEKTGSEIEYFSEKAPHTMEFFSN